MDHLEKTDTTNQERTSRGKVATQYPAGSRKQPHYSAEQGTIGESTAHRLEEQQAVQSNKHGDGTGSGTPDE